VASGQRVRVVDVFAFARNDLFEQAFGAKPVESSVAVKQDKN